MYRHLSRHLLPYQYFPVWSRTHKCMCTRSRMFFNDVFLLHCPPFHIKAVLSHCHVRSDNKWQSRVSAASKEDIWLICRNTWTHEVRIWRWYQISGHSLHEPVQTSISEVDLRARNNATSSGNPTRWGGKHGSLTEVWLSGNRRITVGEPTVNTKDDRISYLFATVMVNRGCRCNLIQLIQDIVQCLYVSLYITSYIWFTCHFQLPQAPLTSPAAWWSLSGDCRIFPRTNGSWFYLSWFYRTGTV